MKDFIYQLRDAGLILNKFMRDVCKAGLRADEKFAFEDPTEFLNYLKSY